MPLLYGFLQHNPLEPGYQYCMVPGLGRSSGGGKGNLLQHSCLENPMNRSLAGYSPRGCEESDIAERLSMISRSMKATAFCLFIYFIWLHQVLVPAHRIFVVSFGIFCWVHGFFSLCSRHVFFQLLILNVLAQIMNSLLQNSDLN